MICKALQQVSHPQANVRTIANLADDEGKDTVGPLERGRVERAVQLVLAQRLGVDHVEIDLLALGDLRSLAQRLPRRRLACKACMCSGKKVENARLTSARRSDHDNTVRDVEDLVQLHDLVDPRRFVAVVLLLAHRRDGVAQRLHVRRCRQARGQLSFQTSSKC